LRLAQCARRPENKASERYLSYRCVPSRCCLLKNADNFLQQKALKDFSPSREVCLLFAEVAVEFMCLQEMCGSQTTQIEDRHYMVATPTATGFEGAVNTSTPTDGLGARSTDFGRPQVEQRASTPGPSSGVIKMGWLATVEN